MLFLTPNEQCQSTEDKDVISVFRIALFIRGKNVQKIRNRLSFDSYISAVKTQTYLSGNKKS